MIFSPILNSIVGRDENLPVYLVGGSVRDGILGRSCHDHDFVVDGDASAYAEKVAEKLGTKVITIGKGSKAT